MVGLAAVQRQGGQTIVQDPVDADWEDLPLNALRAVEADHVVPLRQLSFTIAMCMRGQDAAGSGVEHV